MQLQAAGIPIVFQAGCEHPARVIAQAVEKTAGVLSRLWNLSVPSRTTVHVLLDGPQFVEDTAPKRWKAALRFTRPLWRSRVEQVFSVAGGWTLPWKEAPAVGVKPPELLSEAQSGLGKELFVAPRSPEDHLVQITAHELTHACTASLRLPQWHNEGLAMRAVDHVVGFQTVLETSKDWIAEDPSVFESRRFRSQARKEPRELLRLYATGYWAVRHWEDQGLPLFPAR